VPRPRITAIATATPPYRFTQVQLLARADSAARQRRGVVDRSDVEGHRLNVDPEAQTRRRPTPSLAFGHAARDRSRPGAAGPEGAERGRLALESPRQHVLGDGPVVVLDVGGGAAGLALRGVARERRHGRRLRMVVVERQPATLALAWRACARYPEVALVLADATVLPVRFGAAHDATGSLTLHHPEPDAATTSRPEMARTAGLGAILNDLLRTALSCALIWIGARLFGCHRIAWHDGPLSVRRAYFAAGLRAMALRAELGPLVTRRYPLLGRLAAVAL